MGTRQTNGGEHENGLKRTLGSQKRCGSRSGVAGRGEADSLSYHGVARVPTSFNMAQRGGVSAGARGVNAEVTEAEVERPQGAS